MPTTERDVVSRPCMGAVSLVGRFSQLARFRSWRLIFLWPLDVEYNVVEAAR
jgi:hypothetical protein